MTAREAYLSVRNQLKSACIREPEAKAREIVSHALGVSYADIFFYQHVEPNDFEAIEAMTRRCMRCEPVQYVSGSAYFRRLKLSVTRDVLIPRKETELTAQRAIDLAQTHHFTSVLDMCTGSGCIAISLATETLSDVEACDISEKALKVARQNAIANGAAVRFFASDMFAGVTRAYDLIVCNPPYVSDKEYEKLSEDVRGFEPQLALAAGDGLKFYRRIAEEAAQYLSDAVCWVLEIGARQASRVASLLSRDFDGVACFKDYEGRDRIVTAHKKQGIQCLKSWTNIREDLPNSKTS
jgi:release factor glutamine methyltransferase